MLLLSSNANNSSKASSSNFNSNWVQSDSNANVGFFYIIPKTNTYKTNNIAKYYGKYVRIIQVINYAKYFRINFIRNGKAYYADSRDKTLFYSIHRLNHFPINFKITKYDWRIYTKNRKEKVKPQT